MERLHDGKWWKQHILNSWEMDLSFPLSNRRVGLENKNDRNFFPDVNDDSVIHALKLLYPKLENQLLLAKQVALIEALKDLASHEEDTSFFAPEYLHILNNAETLMAEFKRQPAKLERLYGKIACCPPASA